jgi:hypothetical protein
VPILCIDEGHLLTHDALEALRLLTNHRLDTESPFATILLGQPTLAAKMALGNLAALEQRITVRRTMTGMTSQETAGYIRHHVQLAGRSDPLFTDDATALIHESGRGKPRAVNRLALAALIAACAAGKNLVDEASARSAVTETSQAPTPRRHPDHRRDTPTTQPRSKPAERGYFTAQPASPAKTPPCARSVTRNTGSAIGSARSSTGQLVDT